MHIDEDLPPMSHRPSPHPQPLVQGVLYVIHLVHIRDDLPRRREFSVRDPDLGFAIAGSKGLRESWGRRYHFLFDYSSRGNPRPRNLEGLRKVADVIRQLPRGIDVLPVQYVSLGRRNQQKILYPERRLTYMIQLSNRMPAHNSNEVPGSVLGASREVGLDGHQVIGNSIGNGSLHGVRAKLEEWEIMVGQPRHQPAVIGRT